MQTERSQTSSTSFTETAFDWYQRSRRKAAWQEIPRDASTAAWAFCRNPNTGISFLDAALRRRSRHHHQQHRQQQQRTADAYLPVVIHLTGDNGSGKTWTLLSLAARFVAATLSSKFEQNNNFFNDNGMMISKEEEEEGNGDDNDEVDSEMKPPCVIVLDSALDITMSKLTHVVRSTVLRQVEEETASTTTTHTSWQRNVTDCLRRIHIAQITNPATDAVPLLEALRHELHHHHHHHHHPTLLLWDGFLYADEVTRTEVLRQLVRLQEDCNVFIVLATTTTATSSSSSAAAAAASFHHSSLDRLVTHRIRLQKRPSATSRTTQGHDYVATVQGTQIPFSITLSGILS